MQSRKSPALRRPGRALALNVPANQQQQDARSAAEEGRGGFSFGRN
ncbi:hypothetical protein PAMC26510_19575 [Caballeronia sordidicola]|uniref:Uncharacterized protein n=1 Tax=Caballeronia sordidicola TaxID=196367 RepID=A0A242MQ73_CABSO|nr:hypothetical protein PAMC26510_19575 [Caballeronia sordidicola]